MPATYTTSCNSGNLSDSAVTWSRPGARPLLSADTANSNSSLVTGPCSNWEGDSNTRSQQKGNVGALDLGDDKRLSK